MRERELGREPEPHGSGSRRLGRCRCHGGSSGEDGGWKQLGGGWSRSRCRENSIDARGAEGKNRGRRELGREQSEAERELRSRPYEAEAEGNSVLGGRGRTRREKSRGRGELGVGRPRPYEEGKKLRPRGTRRWEAEAVRGRGKKAEAEGNSTLGGRGRGKKAEAEGNSALGGRGRTRPRESRLHAEEREKVMDGGKAEVSGPDAIIVAHGAYWPHQVLWFLRLRFGFFVRVEVPAAIFEHSEAVVPVGRAADDGPSPSLCLQKSNG